MEGLRRAIDFLNRNRVAIFTFIMWASFIITARKLYLDDKVTAVITGLFRLEYKYELLWNHLAVAGSYIIFLALVLGSVWVRDCFRQRFYGEA